MKQSMETLTSSESNEWYTPPEIIELVRKLGPINLDPASTDLANQVVQAEKIFTVEDNGLEREWFGNVFLNPPYSKTGNKSNQEIWLDKTLEEYYNGNINQAVVLTKTVPGYVWWDRFFHRDWPQMCCITYDRVSFWKPEWMLDGKVEIPANKKSKAASTLWFITYSDLNLEMFDYYLTMLGTVFNFETNRFRRIEN